MRRPFQTTTALLASLSLAVPAPLLAQEAAPVVCTDGSAVPCMPGLEPLTAEGTPVEGTTMTPEQQAERAAQAAEAVAAEQAAAAEAAAADAKAAEEAAARKAAEDAAAAEAKAAEEAAAQKAADEAAAADAKAAEEAAAQKAADEAAKAEAASADSKAAEEAAAAQKAADEATAAAAAAALAAQEEAAKAAQAAADAAAAENAAVAQKALEATQDGNTATDTTEAPADATVTEAVPVAEPTEEELTKQLTEQLGVTPMGEAAAEPVAVPDLPVQPDAATGTAPVAAAAATPVADTATQETAAPDAGVVVTEETVTEGSVRTSAEDFANKVNVTAAEAVAETVAAPAAAATAAQPAAKKKDRLSDLEKALLVGLGAVAVGAILSNNRKVALNSGDRVVVTRDDGSYQIIKDDDTLIRQPGSNVRTERFNDGSTRTTVTRPDGSRIVTIRDAEYRVLRRVHIDRAGRQSVLIDDTVEYEPVDVTTLPKPARQPVIRDTSDELALRLALEREAKIGRSFSLAQIRNIREVRSLVPVIDLDAITFDSGSAAIKPDQARTLSGLGQLIQSYIDENPREVFLIEGHTDATGGAAYNLALSDRRAESVALALTEYFEVPPENLVVQGYGEAFLKVETAAAEQANRRASVRRITDLLRQAAAE
jgi:outer membrane protein OmpA-like peptidoglycan-associated protein